MNVSAASRSRQNISNVGIRECDETRMDLRGRQQRAKIISICGYYDPILLQHPAHKDVVFGLQPAGVFRVT